MEIIFIIGILAAACLFFFIGKSQKGDKSAWEAKVNELSSTLTAKEEVISQQTEQIKTLTAERDVQQAHANNLAEQLEQMRKDHAQRLAEQKED